MSDGPTEYFRDSRYIEPTQAAKPYFLSNPQEESTSSYYHIPLTPPPPPPPELHHRKQNIVLLGISLLGIFLVSTVVYWGVTGAPWQQAEKPPFTPTPVVFATDTPTPTPTATPTSTPTPIPTAAVTVTPILTGNTAPYSEFKIVGYFYQAGLAPYITHTDTNWSCCEYYPEGGASYWNDLKTGVSVDLATFASIDETEIDGKNLADKGFTVYITNYCLLSYSGTLSDLQDYLTIMSQVCL